MINRIKEIAAHFGLSSTAFADRIEVARPVISHIFSERNRPSLEVVQKIGMAFPEINPDWLVFGKGPMLRKMTTTEESVMPAKKITEPERVEDTAEKEGSLNKINAIPAERPIVPELAGTPARTIRKVLIFYSDHTFEEFNPSA